MSSGKWEERHPARTTPGPERMTSFRMRGLGEGAAPGVQPKRSGHVQVGLAAAMGLK